MEFMPFSEVEETIMIDLKGHLKAKRRAFTRNQPYWTSILNFPAFRTGRNKFLLFKMPSVGCFLLAQAD